MTKRINVLILLGLTTIFSGFFVGSFCGQFTAQAVTGARLSLKVSAPKARYNISEPIPLTAVLRNETGEPIRWKGTFVAGQNISIFTRDSFGQERQQKGRYLGLMKMGETAMAPGEQLQQEIVLRSRQVDFLMPNSGRYEIRIGFGYFEGSNNQQIQLMSDPFVLEIPEPTATEREAHQFLRNEIMSAVEANDLNQQIAVRRLFSTRYRSSAYYPYNSFELANLLNKVGNIESAENELYEISDIDFYYSPQVEIQLKSLGARLGQATPRTKRPRVQSNIPGGVWVVRPDIRPNYNIAPIPAPVLVPNPTATPRIQ